MLWLVEYYVGNTYKSKWVKADNAQQAIKRARVKNIEDLLTYEEYVADCKKPKDLYQLRDF